MSMKDEQDALDKHFQIVKLMTSKISVNRTSDQVETVATALSLTATIEDAEERAGMLQTYRSALEEVVAILPQRVSEGLVFETPEDTTEYERGCKEAIDDAMQHIEAIWTGTHKWSATLAQNDPEEARNPDKLPQYISGVQLVLHLKKISPGKRISSVFFLALLYDLRVPADKHILPLDSDYGASCSPEPE